MQTLRVVLGVGLVAFGCCGVARASLVGTLYGTDGTNLYAFTQAGLTTYNQALGNEFALAVGSTVRTLGVNAPGAEYTLAGTPTGTQYGDTGIVTPDGTTDGTYNYAIASTGNVYSFSRTWTNPQDLGWGLAGGYGISYDATDNTLWLSDGASNTLREFSLAGAPISQFNAVTAALGVAYNPADDSLWFSNAKTLYHYTTAGAFIESQTYNAVAGTITGLEFSETSDVPEPGTFGAILGGAALLAVRRLLLRQRDRHRLRVMA